MNNLSLYRITFNKKTGYSGILIEFVETCSESKDKVDYFKEKIVVEARTNDINRTIERYKKLSEKYEQLSNDEKIALYYKNEASINKKIISDISVINHKNQKIFNQKSEAIREINNLVRKFSRAKSLIKYQKTLGYYPIKVEINKVINKEPVEIKVKKGKIGTIKMPVKVVLAFGNGFTAKIKIIYGNRGISFNYGKLTFNNITTLSEKITKKLNKFSSRRR